MKARIIRLATELGNRRIPMEEIAGRFNRRAEVVTAKNGVTALYAFDESQDVVGVAVRVCERALGNLPKDVVTGIFGTSNFTGPTLMPSFTATVAHKLGLRNVICDHIGLGCAGGMQALRNAYNQLAVDTFKGKESYYLVVCGDQMDRIIDPTSLNTSVFFSDGCAAILLTNNLMWCDMGYEVEQVETMSLLNENYDMLTINNPFTLRGQPTPWIEMRGKKVYDFASEMMTNVRHLIGSNADTIQSGYLIPHQANARLIEQIIAKNNLSPERVYSKGIQTIGNLLNGSTFFGLEDLLKNDLETIRDLNVFLLGFGAEQQVGIAQLKPLRPRGILR